MANGQRLSKTHPLFAVLGGLDELNAVIGQAVTLLKPSKLTVEFATQLITIQSYLFYVGAEFAQAPQTTVPKNALPTIEKWSSTQQAQLQDRWMEKFLLPGGTQASAVVDTARAICRRVEREAWITDASDEFSVRPELLRFLNRLSDYLYILRCSINDTLGEEDIPFIS